MGTAFKPPSALEALVLRDLIATGELNGHRDVELGFPWRLVAPRLLGGTRPGREDIFLGSLVEWEYPTDAQQETITAVVGSPAGPDAEAQARARDYGFAPESATALLAREFPPLLAVVPGMLFEGSALLCGSPKSGKTLLMYGLAIAVATGGYVLGSIPVAPARVLYLSLEDGPRRAQRRVAKILAGRPAPDRLEFIYQAEKLGDSLLSGLSRYVERYQDCKLIVIDTLASVRAPAKWRGGSAFQMDYDELAPLTRFAQEHRLAIVVVHHTRKLKSDDPMDMVNATQGAGASVDAVLVLQRTRTGDGTATLAVMGRDLDEELNKGLRYDPQIAGYVLAGSAEDVRMTSARKVVLGALRQAGRPLTAQEVADATGREYKDVRQLLFQLLEDGVVVRPERGKFAAASFGESD